MFKTSFFILLSVIYTSLLNSNLYSQNNDPSKGNVIFIHPDGTGLTTWNAMRVLYYGPDSFSNWDRLPGIGLYRSHMKDCLTAESHGGGTTHAYGVKVKQDSYGLDGDEEIISRSGKKMSIIDEAMEAGIKTGLINSGSIIEPGTGAFVANVPSRGMNEEISKQIVESGLDLMMFGGEEWLLPEGVKGKHCENGRRKDGLNLIEYLKSKNYYIIYNKNELFTIPESAEKIFAVFCEGHSFNDESEEEQNELGLENYKPGAPTLAEMTESAVKFLSKNDSQFFLVVEEEGTDNFGNKCNARGMLEALKRADDAIGIVTEFIKTNPNTLLVTAADSEAGGIDMFGIPLSEFNPEEVLPAQDRNGAPFDGIGGTSTYAFLSAPDQSGNRLPFMITWSNSSDGYGSVVSRSAGLNAELMRGSIDNTDIYKIMYATLFGKLLN